MCIVMCMDKRTNAVLDEELLEEARKYSDVSSTRQLVDVASREFVENHRRRDLRELRGRVEVRSDYAHKKLRTEER